MHFALDWPIVMLGGIALILLPHLLLRVPAVHAKLSNDKKSAENSKGKMAGYDIRAPRSAQNLAADDTPEGRYIGRLNGQHANSHENFVMLCASIFAALNRGVSLNTINSAATIWLFARVFYSFFYIFGESRPMGVTRALLYMVGLAANVYLLVLCIH